MGKLFLTCLVCIAQLVQLSKAFNFEFFTSIFNKPYGFLPASFDVESNEIYKSMISWDINSGCPDTNCSLNGTFPVTIANITIVDDPAQQWENHWLWSVIGHPTIQAAITQPGSYLKINWKSILGLSPFSKSLEYDEVPHFSSAVMLTRLIEFNDTDESGLLENAKHEDVIIYSLKGFQWVKVLVENMTDRSAIQLIGENYTSVGAEHHLTKGTVNLTLSCYARTGFGRWLPHLSHSERTNQFDIQLQNLTSNSGFKASRFALEMAIVSNSQMNKSDNLTRQSTTTLDDEHTPGIFITEELIIPGPNSSLQSYLQWRPVVYTTPMRDLSSSTGLHVGKPKDVKNAAELYNYTLLDALYGDDLEKILVKNVNVTFGRTGDGFFKKTNYNAWTFTFGTGMPIENGLSEAMVFAIVVLFIFLIVILIAAILVCCIKKYRKKPPQPPIPTDRNVYENLQESDSDG